MKVSEFLDNLSKGKTFDFQDYRFELVHDIYWEVHQKDRSDIYTITELMQWPSTQLNGLLEFDKIGSEVAASVSDVANPVVKPLGVPSIVSETTLGKIQQDTIMGLLTEQDCYDSLVKAGKPKDVAKKLAKKWTDQAIKSGKVSSSYSDQTGYTCDICGQKIKPDEVAYETTDSEGNLMHVCIDCDDSEDSPDYFRVVNGAPINSNARR